MGKRIISQARGKGSLSYRVRKKAFVYKIEYLPLREGQARVIKLIHSAAHSAPLMKMQTGNKIFYNVAFRKVIEGQSVNLGRGEKEGDIVEVGKLPIGVSVYNIEKNPGDGGKMVRAAGTSAIVHKNYEHGKVGLMMPHKHEIILDGTCRATIGVVAGEGKRLKPFVTAGRKFYKMKAKGGRIWPRTSAVKMNAIDHPFGSGRGKRIKSKIAPRNAPPGRRVGHLRPRRTGRR
jgi:large subunit ribosomal protein L2